ncbi:hypothetical protein [Mycolicibacterium confluentis]|uniref:Uncharacterized protein n=1 Tax=Mycolicibacterium confluentis TaxID=28047 RepID=A0A7I7Y0K5_9MYCO|nr:hypothetical protein [Mycolicibacterium confluentis]MCV7319854.1 hypothetical protein [Mycolicibacterium confluentis]ORV34425.1 hypothetical protein AWB99_02060 [Mycolicibacterium confluentis]BBZ34884.1 hypothetical protein MCNF_34890 [Mycolicibacterium confluentis]
MNHDLSERMRQVVAELEALGVPHRDPELAAVSMALLIEDVFGVLLSDSDITPDLGSAPEGLHRIFDRLPGRL